MLLHIPKKYLLEYFSCCLNARYFSHPLLSIYLCMSRRPILKLRPLVFRMVDITYQSMNMEYGVVSKWSVIENTHPHTNTKKETVEKPSINLNAYLPSLHCINLIVQCLELRCYSSGQFY